MVDADSRPDAAAPAAPSRGEARRAAILAAAIDQFASHGVAATSMSKIAAAAGVSRPALYQYFRDKDEIFASAFVDLFEGLVRRALAELDRPAATADRLDGFLQRYEGDLFERMSASAHLDEIADAKNEELSSAISAVVSRLDAGLQDFLRSAAPSRPSDEQLAAWVELLRLAPTGLRFDQPSVGTLRTRLTALAHAVASDIGTG